MGGSAPGGVQRQRLLWIFNLLLAAGIRAGQALGAVLVRQSIELNLGQRQMNRFASGEQVVSLMTCAQRGAEFTTSCQTSCASNVY